MNSKYLKTVSTIVLSTLIILSILPATLFIPIAKAQGQIILSSPNLNPYKIIELDIRLPGVDVNTVPLRLYDAAGNKILDFEAHKLATGRYIAYLGGHYAPPWPENPKISPVTGTFSYATLAETSVDPTKTTTLTLEVLGYDVKVDIPFKPVATSLTVDRTTIPVRTDLQAAYMVTLTISDQDLNFDPTKTDVFTGDSLSRIYLNVMLVKKGTTGETFGGVVDLASAKPNLVFRETTANSGAFVTTLSVKDILDLIEAADPSFTGDKKKLDVGDLLIIEAASNIIVDSTKWGNDYTLSDSKTLNAVYNYPSVSIDFTSQKVVITITSPDDNANPRAVDYLYQNVIINGTSVTPGMKKFKETGVNTGVFKYELSVKWCSTSSIDVDNDVVCLAPDKPSFTVTAVYLDVPASAKYTPVAPEIVVEKATVVSVVLSVTDPDLNNDPNKLETLSADVDYNSGIIKFSKDGVTLYEVVIKDTTGKNLLKGLTNVKYSPSFIETDLNSNVFKLMLPSKYINMTDGKEYQLLAPGKTYVIEVTDHTGPKYLKSITVTIAEIKIELDRSVYPINLDKNVVIYVKYYDDRFNTDATKIDTVPSGTLKYYIYNPTTGKPVLPDTSAPALSETGPNTGIFVGKIEIPATSPAFIGAKIVIYKAGEEQYKAEAKFDVYQVTPGDLSVDKTVVPINGTIVITVYDPDANVDSAKNDSVSVDVYVDGVKKTVAWSLVETGVNTGTFTYKILVFKDIPGVKPGSTIKFVYVDKTPIVAPTAGDFGTPVTVSVTVKVASFTGELKVPKDWVGPYEIMSISVIDPDLNMDPGRAESVTVAVSIEGEAETKTLTLTETGMNTGVFVGRFSLGWWKTGNVEATLDVKEAASYIGKKVTITYVDDVDATGARRVNVVTLTIKAVDAEIKVDKEAVNIGETLTINISNADIAGNPKAEFRRVIIRSTTYPTGVTLYASEVMPGVYQVKVTVVELKDWVPGAPQIPAKLGDTITIEYFDPIAADGTAWKLFSKSVAVGRFVEMPGKAEAVKTVDVTTGAVVEKPSVGKEVFLTLTIRNTDIVERSMTVIVVVRDPAGVAVARYAATVTLGAGAATDVSFGWTPIVSGDHSVEVYIVKSLADRTPVGAPATFTVSVGS